MLRPANIRHRLTLRYLAAFSVIVLLFIAGASALQYIQLTRQMLHAEMEDVETAEGLLSFTPTGQLVFNQRYHNRPRSHLLSDRYMEVLTQAGEVLLRNDKLNGESLGGKLFPDEGLFSYNPRKIILPDGTRLLVISHIHSINNEPLLIRVGYSLAPVWLRTRDFALLLLLALPFALCVAGFAGYHMATDVLRPLDDMASHVTTITASDLSRRLTVENPKDELGHMATVVNDLLERLEASFENLKRFTADASHELRTPLASMRSVGEVALQHRQSPEEYRDVIGSMLEEGERLAGTVDALLSLSRADAGRVAVEKSCFSALDLAIEVAAVLEPLAEEKMQRLEVEGEPALSIYADRLLIQRALTNIVENAIKYAPEGTKIGISIRPVSDANQERIEITVDDEGVTIEESMRTRVFDRFFRIDPSRCRDAGGNGLGLSIAKWAVEVNDGVISLVAAAEKGNRFAIQLPMGETGVPGDLS